MEMIYESVNDLKGTPLMRNTWADHEMGYQLHEMLGHQYSRVMVFATSDAHLPYRTVVVLGYVLGRETESRHELFDKDTDWIREADKDFLADREAARKSGVDMEQWEKDNSGLGQFRWKTHVGERFTQTLDGAESLVLRFGLDGPGTIGPFNTLTEAEQDLRTYLEGMNVAELENLL